MYKSKINKWVGMFVLAMIVFFGLNSNVFAEDVTNACSKASSTYNLIAENHLNEARNYITIRANTGSFNVKVMPYNTTPDVINGIIERKEADQTFSAMYNNKTTTIPGSLASAYGNAFEILVYSTDKSLCGAYYYKVFQISTVDSYKMNVNLLPPAGSRRSAYLNDIAGRSGNASSDLSAGNACGWAHDMVGTVDANMQSVIRNLMPSCFPDGNGNVIYNLSRDNLVKLANKISTLIEVYNKNISIVQKTQLPDLPTPTAGNSWVQINNPKNFKSQYGQLGSQSSSMLTCDRKNDVTEKFLYYINTTNTPVTYKGAEAGEGSKNICTTTCREQLVVTFGPPKAIIAGQCFTYEVEIKSKVQCISNLELNNMPNIAKYIPNDIVPDCNGVNGYENQAGPSEDFDKCVQSCDGGKYTQSCIDSCYDKVYNNKNSKKSSKKAFDQYKENTLSLRKVVGYSSDACPASGTDENTMITIYNYEQARITNNFNGLTFVTKYSDCEWNKYAPYYFSSVELTARTVCNARGYNWWAGSRSCQLGKPRDDSNITASEYEYYKNCNGSCYWGKRGVQHMIKVNHPVCRPCNTGLNGNSRGCCGMMDNWVDEWDGTYDVHGYYVDSQGFKREVGCGDTCRYVPVGGRHYNDREQAENDFVDNVNLYVTEAIGCINKAQAACKEEVKDTYSMTVNYDQDEKKQTCALGSDDANCKSWSATGNKINVSNESNTSILISDGGSCIGRNDDYMYHDILTFPGAWINNKNGKVTYKKPYNTNWYTYKDGNYCTPLNAKNVNAPYWRWYQNTKAGTTTKSFDEWAGSSYIKSIVYNITTGINNFGHYHWNFNTACFYAISDDSTHGPDVCTDKVCDTCTNGACPTDPAGSTNTSTTINNYGTKSYTSTNIFPSGTSADENGEATLKKLSGVEDMVNTNSSSTASRAQGFNWTVGATNLSIKGYPVTPTALIKKIEGTESYSKDDIDYDITLSTADLRKIRNAANNKDSFYVDYCSGESKKNCYTTVTGSGYSTGKRYDYNLPSYTYYYSQYLRDNTKVNKAPKGNGLSCNNLKDSTTCDYYQEFLQQDQELQNWLSR